jgi:hypothetical protein
MDGSKKPCRLWLQGWVTHHRKSNHRLVGLIVSDARRSSDANVTVRIRTPDNVPSIDTKTPVTRTGCLDDRHLVFGVCPSSRGSLAARPSDATETPPHCDWVNTPVTLFCSDIDTHIDTHGLFNYNYEIKHPDLTVEADDFACPASEKACSSYPPPHNYHTTTD